MNTALTSYLQFGVVPEFMTHLLYPTTRTAPPKVTPQKSIIHPVTNESVNAVYAALKPSKEDLIACVCGSGDIPFALSSSGARVVVFDVCKDQLAYAQERLAQLRRGDDKQFLGIPADTTLRPLESECLTERNRFFTQGRRMSQVADANISFSFGDLYTTALGRDVTKVYLSNTLLEGQVSVILQKLMRLSERLQSGAQIYESNAGAIFDNARTYSMLRQAFSESARKGSLDIAVEPTRIARTIERPIWSPLVFSRTSYYGN